MLTKGVRVVAILVLIVAICCFSVAVLYVGSMYYFLYFETEDLEKSNIEKLIFCKNIANHPKFTSGPVDFRIDKGSAFLTALDSKDPNESTLAYTIRLPMLHRTVFLTPGVLDSKCLDFYVAHELGHIQTREGFLKDLSVDSLTREEMADGFAAELLGLPRALECLLPNSNLGR